MKAFQDIVYSNRKNHENIHEKIIANYQQIEGWFRKNTKQNKSYFFQSEVTNSKFGSLSYKKIKTLDNYCLVEVELITGRHHQIRCSFSELGYPIQGDLKYGSKRSNKDGGIYLHSRKVEFVHPVSKNKIFLEVDTPRTGLWTASPSY